MNQSKAPAAPHEPAGWILLVALLAATFVMRGPVTMAGPVAGAIREAFGASLSAYGLLAALPVAAFGAFSFAGPALAGRLGLGRAVLAALLILLAGAALRLVPNWTTLLFATLLVGAGIALLNVMMPVMVRSAWPGRVGSMVGLYTGVIGLSGGSSRRRFWNSRGRFPAPSASGRSLRLPRRSSGGSRPGAARALPEVAPPQGPPGARSWGTLRRGRSLR